ncbi:MAG TPA: YkgJ family cysteine cluster protein [Kofleriaceae bacterium]|nr:YkgJ family cysteine cluster protein [Kofleriaceae bacterium]
MLDECQLCGACCFSASSAYVPVTGADRARLGRAAAELVHHEDGADYLAMIDGHCAALRVSKGAFVCSVYEQRPAVCRELDRGTPPCHEERTLKRATATRLLADRPGSGEQAHELQALLGAAEHEEVTAGR